MAKMISSDETMDTENLPVFKTAARLRRRKLQTIKTRPHVPIDSRFGMVRELYETLQQTSKDHNIDLLMRKACLIGTARQRLKIPAELASLPTDTIEDVSIFGFRLLQEAIRSGGRTSTCGHCEKRLAVIYEVTVEQSSRTWIRFHYPCFYSECLFLKTEETALRIPFKSM